MQAQPLAGQGRNQTRHVASGNHPNLLGVNAVIPMGQQHPKPRDVLPIDVGMPFAEVGAEPPCCLADDLQQSLYPTLMNLRVEKMVMTESHN